MILEIPLLRVAIASGVVSISFAIAIGIIIVARSNPAEFARMLPQIIKAMFSRQRRLVGDHYQQPVWRRCAVDVGDADALTAWDRPGPAPRAAPKPPSGIPPA
jgi:hypothetical protein